MSSSCIVCGAPIAQGILCAKCDRPRTAKMTATSLAPEIETASTIHNILVAAGVPAAILGSDRSVKYVTEELKALVGDARSVQEIKSINDLTKPVSTNVSIHDRKMQMSVVPLASGAAVIFRPIATDPPQISDVPTIVDVIRSVVNRSVAFAEVKGIRLEISTPECTERFRHHDRLADALSTLIDNSLHYAVSGGQVVVGVRPMEHKGKPILLFFVMDNGPLVPEHMKHVIFESGFIWNPNASERTGRGLYKVREFSAAHGGSVWVDSKTGKTCTFFLRVDPD
jgi:signal transduction histidine kinase